MSLILIKLLSVIIKPFKKNQNKKVVENIPQLLDKISVYDIAFGT